MQPAWPESKSRPSVVGRLSSGFCCRMADEPKTWILLQGLLKNLQPYVMHDSQESAGPTQEKRTVKRLTIYHLQNALSRFFSGVYHYFSGERPLTEGGASSAFILRSQRSLRVAANQATIIHRQPEIRGLGLRRPRQFAEIAVVPAARALGFLPSREALLRQTGLAVSAEHRARRPTPLV